MVYPSSSCLLLAFAVACSNVDAPRASWVPDKFPALAAPERKRVDGACATLHWRWTCLKDPFKGSVPSNVTIEVTPRDAKQALIVPDRVN